MTTTITALPTPPSRADTPDTFSAKADALIGALPTLVTQINTVGTEMEVLKSDTAAIKVAADLSTAAIAAGAVADTTAIYNNTVTVYNDTNTLKSDVTTLKSDVTQLKLDTTGIKDTALTYQTGAQTAQGLADTYKTQAQVAAAAAGAAAGLPSLTGNAGKTLLVAAGETGVEWAGSSPSYMKVQDQKSSGTGGGNSTLGENIRTINTVVYNTISGASLASNAITLPAGTYQYVCVSASAFIDNRVCLKNITDSTYLDSGCKSTHGDSRIAQSSGIFVITSSKAFSVAHYFNNAYTGALGIAASTEFPEVYTDLTILKLA